MKITAARVIVCCPGPQLRHAEDRDRPGPHRPRRRHAQRPRAGGGELPDRPRHPLPDRPRRAPDRGHLAVPLPRRLLAARAGDDERDRRGRHRAVGHQGQGRRPAAVPAARRREPRRRDGLRPRQRPRHRADRRRGAALQASMGYKAIRAQSGVPGLAKVYGVGRGTHVLRAGRRRPAERARLVDREVPAPHAAAVRRGARRGRPRHPPAARRAPPPDADRGRRGSARTSSPTACSGWKTRRRPRTRRPSG